MAAVSLIIGCFLTDVTLVATRIPHQSVYNSKAS